MSTLIRARRGKLSADVSFDNTEGVEVLVFQFVSIFSTETADADLCLIDYAGRTIETLEDIENVAVVVGGISDENKVDSTLPIAFTHDGAKPDYQQPSALSESVELSSQQEPSSEVRAESFSYPDGATASSVADIFCFPRNLQNTEGFCTRLFSERCTKSSSGSENAEHVVRKHDLVQPSYRIAETDIRLCSRCMKLFDGSLIVSDCLQLSSFTCMSDVAIQSGMSYPDAEKSMEKDALQLADDSSNAVHLFVKRLILRAAVTAQDLAISECGSAGAWRRREMEHRFVQKLHSGSSTVEAFENKGSLKKALTLIDVPKIRTYAADYGEEQRESGRTEDADVLFLHGLLKWFKCDFFKWTNKPECSTPSCGGRGPSMVGCPSVPPSAEERSHGLAGVTEVYRCQECNLTTRFPRFNDPSRLLDTRRGRCGEWANCFCLICRALHLDVRYVLDFTDHVWAEVWVPSLKRYVHVDPCERAFDTPLMYENGWNKKLTHVLSFSRHGVVDAAARYTRTLDEVMVRRSFNSHSPQSEDGHVCVVTEHFAEKSIRAQCEAQERIFVSKARTDTTATPCSTSTSVTTSISTSISTFSSSGPQEFPPLAADITAHEMRRRKRLLSRELLALQLLSPEESGSKNFEGRISGDVEWKVSRGEEGKSATCATTTSDQSSTAKDNNSNINCSDVTISPTELQYLGEEAICGQKSVPTIACSDDTQSAKKGGKGGKDHNAVVLKTIPVGGREHGDTLAFNSVQFLRSMIIAVSEGYVEESSACEQYSTSVVVNNTSTNSDSETEIETKTGSGGEVQSTLPSSSSSSLCSMFTPSQSESQSSGSEASPASIMVSALSYITEQQARERESTTSPSPSSPISTIQHHVSSLEAVLWQHVRVSQLTIFAGSAYVNGVSMGYSLPQTLDLHPDNSNGHIESTIDTAEAVQSMCDPTAGNVSHLPVIAPSPHTASISTLPFLPSPEESKETVELAEITVRSGIFSSDNDQPVPYTLTLSRFERVSRVRVRYSNVIESMSISVQNFNPNNANGVTEEMHTFGRSDSKAEGRQFCIPQGWAFIGFTGGTGGHLHHLGVVIVRDTADFGGLDRGDMAVPSSTSVHILSNPANSLPASILLSPSSSSSSSPPTSLSSPSVSCIANISYGTQTDNKLRAELKLKLNPRTLRLISHFESSSLWSCAMLNYDQHISSHHRQGSVGVLLSILQAMFRDNTNEQAIQCVTACAIYAENVRQNVHAIKFRTVKMENKYFVKNILSCMWGVHLFCFGPLGFKISTSQPATLTSCVSLISEGGTMSRSAWLSAVETYAAFLKSAAAV